MHTPVKIVVSLPVGQKGLNIVRRVMGHGNDKSLTDGTITEVIPNSDLRYRWKWYKMLITSDDQYGDQ
jgi:hypothetical protein